MNIVYFMIPLALVLVGCAAWAFFWAVGNGQFDDLESPGWSILADDDTRPAPPGGADVPPETRP